MVQKVLTFQ